MPSLGSQLKQCFGLVDTSDLSDWENSFINNIWRTSNEGRDTTKLSTKQAETLQSIFNKHFAQ